MSGKDEADTLPLRGDHITLAQALKVVGLSDRLLAGRFQHVDDAAKVASQAAQTTAGYLGWCVSNYTILVSVSGTALVARFVGAGERREAGHVLHQSLLLAIVFGLLGT